MKERTEAVLVYGSVGVMIVSILLVGVMQLCFAVPVHAQRHRPTVPPPSPSPAQSWTYQLDRTRCASRADDGRCEYTFMDVPLRIVATVAPPSPETLRGSENKPWAASQLMPPNANAQTVVTFPACPSPLPDGTACTYTTARMEVDVPAYTANGAEAWCVVGQMRRWNVEVRHAVTGRVLASEVVDWIDVGEYAPTSPRLRAAATGGRP